jgi:hypothetical protein
LLADCEPADLDAVQAMDTVIEKKIIARNTFMIAMMPEHFPFVIGHCSLVTLEIAVSQSSSDNELRLCRST